MTDEPTDTWSGSSPVPPNRGDFYNLLALLPDDHLRVEITTDDDARRLSFAGRGSRWAGRWEWLEGVLVPWRNA